MRDQSNNPRYEMYWIKMGFSKDESRMKMQSERRKCSIRCKEYWIHKGFSEDESILKMSEMQKHSSQGNIGTKRTEEQKIAMSKRALERENVEYWVIKYGDGGVDRYNKWKDKQKICGVLGFQSRLKNNPNFRLSSQRCKEYWIKKGFSEPDAIKIVSQKQSRNLQFFIKKHGKENGTKKWKKRIDNWRKSFDKNDIDVIDEKRRLNAHVGFYTEDTIQFVKSLHFYMFACKDIDNTVFIKYGLTKQPYLHKRWALHLISNEIIFEKMEPLIALQIEKELNSIFKQSYKPKILKTSECFLYEDENLEKAMEIINGVHKINV